MCLHGLQNAGLLHVRSHQKRLPMLIRGSLLRRQSIKCLPWRTHLKALHFGSLRDTGCLLQVVWALNRVAIRLSLTKRQRIQDGTLRG